MAAALGLPRDWGVILADVNQSAGETIALDVLRGGRELKIRVAVAERPQDPDRILSLVSGEENLVAKLGILAVDLNEKVTPLLPELRRLAGAVVAGIVADMTAHEEPLIAGDVIYSVNNTPVRSLADLKAAVEKLPRGEPVVLHLERMGQLQFVTFDLE